MSKTFLYKEIVKKRQSADIDVMLTIHCFSP